MNIGIGGDKTQNVLWRLDHGGVKGLQPKAIVLMIGNNNMFFTPETGIEAAALGIQMCVKNLREKFPSAVICVAKILPAHAPGHRFYEDIKKTNAALDPLKLDNDPKVKMLDLWSDFTSADGTIKKELFTPDNIHLSPAGYGVYAERLTPLLSEKEKSASITPKHLLLNYVTSIDRPQQAEELIKTTPLGITGSPRTLPMIPTASSPRSTTSTR